MCGACGRTVVSDPVLGPVRTLRQHLIVAQTINSICHSWAGAPKVAATSEGWLVSGRKGAAEAVTTVEQLWAAVLRGSPAAMSDEPDHFVHSGEGEPEDVCLRVLSAGRRLASELAASAAGPRTGS